MARWSHIPVPIVTSHLDRGRVGRRRYPGLLVPCNSSTGSATNTSRSPSATTPPGLRAIVAIHSTVLGPALGGTRFYPYRTEDEAMEDVLRLARGMTYKSAVAGLDLGGGKAVIIGDPATEKTEALLRAYGRFLDGLGGRYITAEDVGTTQADMDIIFEETGNVTGSPSALGGSGDPSAATAYGLWWAIKAVLDHLDATVGPGRPPRRGERGRQGRHRPGPPPGRGPGRGHRRRRRRRPWPGWPGLRDVASVAGRQGPRRRAATSSPPAPSAGS